jgi:hypothetical protein
MCDTNSREHCHGSGNATSHDTDRKGKTPGISKETIVVERIWNKRPDVFAIEIPTKKKEGELVLMEFKRM